MREFHPMYELREAKMHQGGGGSGEFNLFEDGRQKFCPEIGWKTSIRQTMQGPMPDSFPMNCGTWCSRAEARTKDNGDLIFHMNCTGNHRKISKVIEVEKPRRPEKGSKPAIVTP